MGVMLCDTLMCLLTLSLSILPSTDSSPVSPPVTLSDVFISVKTSSLLHSTRLPFLLSTWLTKTGSSTHLFTDGPRYKELASSLALLGVDLVQTDCPADHGRSALCCKMEAELITFLHSSTKEEWFCHLDDDNYLHLPGLLSLLSRHPTVRGQDWYLGRASISHPLEVVDRRQTPHTKVTFMFATGGAGFCLSRGLVERLETQHGMVSGFRHVGDIIRLPDDVTLGYMMETVLGVVLTTGLGLHSHLEPLRRLVVDQELITASYSTYENTSERNTLELGQDQTNDPTGFLALHHHLNPSSLSENGL